MRHTRRIAPALLALLLLLAPLSGGGQAAALPADVAGHWAEPDIQYLADRGVIQWVRAADGSEAFWPRQNITRIDFATWLVRALGLAPVDEVTFTDLAGLAGRGYVEAAARLGLIRGVGAGRFGPNDPITRAAVATLLSRANNLVEEATGTFPDLPASHWGAAHIRRTVRAALFKGDADGNFRPDAPMTRAEAAAVLARAMRSLKPYTETGGLLASAWPKELGDVFNRGRSGQTGPNRPALAQALPALESVIAGQGTAARVYFQPEMPVFGLAAERSVYTGSVSGLVAVAAGSDGTAARTGAPGLLVRSPVLAAWAGPAGAGAGVAFVAAQEPSADGFAEESRIYALPLPLTPAAAAGDWAAASLWTPPVVEGSVAGLTVAGDGSVYVATTAGHLASYAFPRQGQPAQRRWLLGPDLLGAITAAPALGLDGTIYVAAGSKLVAVTRAGDIKWETDVAARISAAPMVDEGGVVYVGDNAGRLHAFWPGGRLRWTAQLGGKPLAGGVAVSRDGHLFAGDTGGTLHSVDSAGRLRWRKALDSYLSAPVVAADGTVYVGSLSGRLHALGSDGKLRWQFDPAAVSIEWMARNGPLRLAQPALASPPALAPDGTLWLRSGGWLLQVGEAGGAAK